jgi:PAS domain S-box-containing protein
VQIDDPRSLILAGIEHLPVVLFAFDAEERFVVSQGGGLSSLGRQSGAVVGMTLSEVHETNPAIVDAVRRAMRGDRVSTTIEADGVSFEATYLPIMHGDNVEGVIGIAFDITESRQTERLLQGVLERSTDAVVVASRQGVVMLVNPAAERMFGYAAGAMVGQQLISLIPAEFRQLHVAGMERYLATGEAKVLGRWLRLEGLRADGSHFPLELHVSAIDDRSRTAFVGVMRDVTQLEFLKRLREETLASLSHEFRTPLAAISMFKELVETAADIPPLVNDYLDVIDRNVKRLIRLVDDLVVIGSTEESESSFARETADLVSIVARTVTAARPDAQALGISLIFEPVPGPHVNGDAERLEQVFDHLLQNAVRFTPPGGSIRIRCEAGESEWVVSVVNSDSFIPLADLGPLFEPFVGRRASDAGMPGAGLGLALARRIVERHHGSLEMSSSPEEGTTLTVRLPVETPGEPARGVR